MAAALKNLLFIVADQWRGDTLGALGAGVLTPNLDGLAARGMLFANHYCQASPCGPARASMLTGLYMHNHRQVTNWTPLESRFTTLGLEIEHAVREAALFGYTDTPLDPVAPRPGGRPWICPGFTPIAPFLFADGFRDWFRWLAARGYEPPENPRHIYRQPPDWVAVAGRDAHPPSRLRAEDTDTAWLTEAALRYIRVKGEGPWVAHVNYLRPHPPMHAPVPYDLLHGADDMAPPRRPASPEDIARQHPFLAWALREQVLSEYFLRRLAPEEIGPRDDLRMRATYYGNCAEVDHQVGRLLADLEARGLAEETLVVFTSDHGEQFGDNWLYGRRGPFDGHFHVPLIIRDPRPGRPAGERVEAFTESVDLMATMLEALGLPAIAQGDGRSLIPWLEGRAPDEWRDDAYFEYDFRGPEGLGPERALGLPSEACHMAILRTRTHKYVRFAGLPPLLYDLEEDPGETRNRAGDTALATVRGEMAERLLDRRLAHEAPGRTDHQQVHGREMRHYPRSTDLRR